MYIQFVNHGWWNNIHHFHVNPYFWFVNSQGYYQSFIGQQTHGCILVIHWKLNHMFDLWKRLIISDRLVNSRIVVPYWSFHPRVSQHGYWCGPKIVSLSCPRIRILWIQVWLIILGRRHFLHADVIMKVFICGKFDPNSLNDLKINILQRQRPTSLRAFLPQ